MAPKAFITAPLLAREQELRLTSAIACGDPDAKQLLIEVNLGLVFSIARAYATSLVPLAGSAAYISRYHALVKAGPVQLSGFVGWLAWGCIHLTFLAGVRNRVGASITWLLALSRGKRRERAIPFGDPRAPQDSFPAPKLGD